MFEFTASVHALRIRATAAIMILACVGIAHAQSWVRTNGPYGGEVTGLVVRQDTVDFSTVLAYHSTDGGLTWKEESQGSVVFTAVDSGTVLWGVDAFGQHVYFKYDDDGTASNYRSTLTNTLSLASGSTVSYFVAPSGTRYAYAEPAGNILARNAATEWDPWTVVTGQGMPPHIDWMDINPRTGHFHMFSYDSVLLKPFYYTSTDSAGHWTKHDLGYPDSLTVYIYNNTVTKEGLLFYTAIVYGTPSITYHTMRSTDDGATWSEITAGLPPSCYPSSTIQTDSVTLYAVETGTTRTAWPIASHDAGLTWTELPNDGLSGVSIGRIAHLHGQAFIATGLNGGVFRTTDTGAHWTVSAEGIPWASTSAMCVDSSGSVYTCTQESGVYRSSDHGDHWERCINGIPGGGTFGLTTTPQGTVIASGPGVYRSTDHGATWTISTTGIQITRGDLSIALSSGDIIAADGKYMYFSTDDGLTWQPSVAPIPSSLSHYFTAAGSGSVAAVATDAGAYCTVDGGRTWTLSTKGLVVPYLRLLAFTPANIMFAVGSDSTIFRSDDSCKSWTVCPDMPHPPGGSPGYTAMKFIPGVGLVVGINNALDSLIYISRDYGKTWNSICDGYFVRRNNINRFTSDGTFIYASTLASVWRRDIATSVALTPPRTPSISIEIHPNPVSGTGMITVGLALYATIDLRLTDCLGRTVAQIAHGTRAPGEHTYTFDTGALTPGVYFCTLKTLSGMLHRAVTIVR